MNYITFRNTLRKFPVFSLIDARAVDPGFDRRRLNEWQAKGYIRKIINRHYLFTDIDIDENRLFEIAGRIYKPSYISLRTVLYVNLARGVSNSYVRRVETDVMPYTASGMTW
ncbi:MAG TPA: hypothetical protein ENI27_03800 [bacterium]|nr:hypothetical protein [bacterium]